MLDVLWISIQRREGVQRRVGRVEGVSSVVRRERWGVVLKGRVLVVIERKGVDRRGSLRADMGEGWFRS